MGFAGAAHFPARAAWRWAGRSAGGGEEGAAREAEGGPRRWGADAGSNGRSGVARAVSGVSAGRGGAHRGMDVREVCGARGAVGGAQGPRPRSPRICRDRADPARAPERRRAADEARRSPAGASGRRGRHRLGPREMERAVALARGGGLPGRRRDAVDPRPRRVAVDLGLRTALRQNRNRVAKRTSEGHSPDLPRRIHSSSLRPLLP